VGFSNIVVPGEAMESFAPVVARLAAPRSVTVTGARTVSAYQLREGVTDHGVLGAVLDHADRAPDRPAVKDLDRALTRASCAPQLGEWPLACFRKASSPGSGCPADRQFCGLRGGGPGLPVAGSRSFLWRSPTRSPPCADRGRLPARAGDHRGLGPNGAIGLSAGTAWTSISALSAADGPTPPP